MNVPNTYTEKNETGCCAVPNVSAWDEEEVTFEDAKFVRMYTKSFLYIPLNMGKVMTALQKTAVDAGVTMPASEAMILSREVSPWRAEQLYRVSETVEGADNVTLSGDYLTKVFEGPFKNVGKWHKSLLDFVKSKGKDVEGTYFFYTTCPNCAKHYGKNYVIGLAKTA